MIDALSVLLSRLTAARAAFLDAAVSSIAAAATAVSTATWTAAKFAFLDTTVSGRATSIKSIQAGTITLASVASNTATITSVNTAKAFIIWLGCVSNDTTNDPTLDLTQVTLTSGTVVTATRGGATATAIVGYMVVEFN